MKIKESPNNLHITILVSIMLVLNKENCSISIDISFSFIFIAKTHNSNLSLNSVWPIVVICCMPRVLTNLSIIAQPLLRLCQVVPFRSCPAKWRRKVNLNPRSTHTFFLKGSIWNWAATIYKGCSVFFYLHEVLHMLAEIVMKGNTNSREHTGEGGRVSKVHLQTPPLLFSIPLLLLSSLLFLITHLHSYPLFLCQECASSKGNSNSMSDAIDLLWEAFYLANRKWKKEFPGWQITGTLVLEEAPTVFFFVGFHLFHLEVVWFSLATRTKGCFLRWAVWGR